MTSLSELVKRLRGLAEKATPGPWIRSGVRLHVDEGCLMVGPDGGLIIAIPTGCDGDSHAGAFNDAGYLAALDPTTVKRLIAAARTAQPESDGAGRSKLLEKIADTIEQIRSIEIALASPDFEGHGGSPGEVLNECLYPELDEALDLFRATKG